MTALLRFVLLILLAGLAGGRELRLQDLKVATRVMNDVEYVPLVQVAGALGGSVWQVANKFIVMLPPKNDAGYEIVFTEGRNRVLVNNRPVMLPVPFRFIDNDVYVPTVFLNELFPVQLSRMPQVRSLSLSHLRDTTILRIETDTTAYYSSIAVTSTTFRIYLQADCRIRRMDPTALVSRLEFNQRNGTELIVNTREPCFCRVSRTEQGIAVKFTPRRKRLIGTIVIDPGHGGRDPGAQGRRLKEKDANLDIARRLAKRLRQTTRAEVVLTRERDEYVGLADRPHLANRVEADLYVSIHCNAAPDAPGAQGFETFFLSAARNDWERAVMSRENGALDFPVPDTNRVRSDMVGTILRDLAQNEFLRESQDLAGRIQASAGSWLRGKDRGVKQADFVVLRLAYMPAVLVECGFLTNPAEEKLLSDGNYRDRVAAAIAGGVAQFITALENREKKQ